MIVGAAAAASGIGAIGLIIIIALYFLPTIVAFSR